MMTEITLPRIVPLGPPTLVIPEGHIVTFLDPKWGDWYPWGLREITPRDVLLDPENHRVIPSEWVAEAEAMAERHDVERRTLHRRVKDAPRFVVTVTLTVPDE